MLPGVPGSSPSGSRGVAFDLAHQPTKQDGGADSPSTPSRAALAGVPLAAAVEALGRRNHNILARAGFETLESVAEASDDVLMCLPGVGLGTLDAIRAVVGSAGANRYGSHGFVVLTPARVGELHDVLERVVGFAESHGAYSMARQAAAFLTSLKRSDPAATAGS